MFGRKRQLIVPIRDRRQRRRILTLKNFGKATLAIAALVVAVTVYSNVRGLPAGDYGRLFGRQVAVPNDDFVRKTGIVAEAPVPDQSVPDPMLVAPAAREQLLHADSNVPPAAPVAPASVAAAPATFVASNVATEARGRGLAIVGDGTSIAIVRGAAGEKPVLSGGIFKQP